MNKKHQKKKQKKKGRGERNKENIEDVAKETVTEVEKEKEDLCYEVKHSEVMGRYIVASRPVKAGDVIMSERALCVGPCSGCALICLGCYRELLESSLCKSDVIMSERALCVGPCSGCALICLGCYREQLESSLCKCRGCKWPLCSPSCPGLGQHTGHSAQECELLKTVPPDYSDLEELKECYHALMPLRCLLLKSSDPSKWSALSAMESHNALRRARGDIYPLNQRLVVDRIRNWGLTYEEEEVHTVCGILEVNAFEVGGSGANARALYDRAYLMAHDCTPSTTHTDAEAQPGRPLTIRASVDHSVGDLFTACYAYTLQGTLKRREHLTHSKFFSCCCARCADPTELGTFASAFLCPRCAQALLPAAPLDAGARWTCGCGYSMPPTAVQMLLRRLTDEFDAIDANDVSGFEAFLHKYRNVVHHQHYLCLSAKHSLSQLYGKVAEYMIHEMPEKQLARKVQICRDLMTVFDVIEPGYSRLRGVTLYELHAPLMILTTRDFEKKAISKENLRKRLKEIFSYLTEAALILGFEPRQSSEGLMAAAAREALKKIKTWEQIIGKIS